MHNTCLIQLYGGILLVLGDSELAAWRSVVIRKTRGGVNSKFTVRKISFGVGVERIFPLHSPRYEKIEVLSHGRARRSRLFYLRNLRGKAARQSLRSTKVSHKEAAALAAQAAAGAQ